MTEKYLSPLVSCLTCREVKSAKGIFSHFITSHTEEGKRRQSKNAKIGSSLGTQALKKLCEEKRNKNLLKYSKNPSICQCGNLIDYNLRKNKYCSASCGASYANKTRSVSGWKMTAESKLKLSNRMKGVPQLSRRLNYSKISYCVICNTLIKNKHSKTCSGECKSSLLSISMIERIKKNKRSNYRRDKRSYLEESFENWLEANDIRLEVKSEHTIRNHLTDKWYFVDFYFPGINLIVELDGKQHEKKKHKEADIARDSYIKEHLDIDVFRISYDEYQEKTKINQLLDLFKISGGLCGNRTHL